MNNPNNRLIWMDLETTGLDEKKHEVLEVACVITDSQLNELAVYEEVIWSPADIWERCSPFIRKMHGGGASALLQEVVRVAKKEASDVERELLTFFHKNGVEPNKGILAGASVHFDRRFIGQYMPLLEAFFYHRMFDVSALKTAAQMWAPHLVPEGEMAHRALADVHSSIALAKHFYEKLFAQPRRLADVVCDFLRRSERRDEPGIRKLEDTLTDYDPNWATR